MDNPRIIPFDLGAWVSQALDDLKQDWRRGSQIDIDHLVESPYGFPWNLETAVNLFNQANQIVGQAKLAIVVSLDIPLEIDGNPGLNTSVPPLNEVMFHLHSRTPPGLTIYDPRTLLQGKAVTYREYVGEATPWSIDGHVVVSYNCFIGIDERNVGWEWYRGFQIERYFWLS